MHGDSIIFHFFQLPIVWHIMGEKGRGYGEKTQGLQGENRQLRRTCLQLLICRPQAPHIRSLGSAYKELRVGTIFVLS